jgi:hypothetical protein
MISRQDPLILHRGQHKIIDIFHGRQNGKLHLNHSSGFARRERMDKPGMTERFNLDIGQLGTR